jgi:hypothetical protein
VSVHTPPSHFGGWAAEPPLTGWLSLFHKRSWMKTNVSIDGFNFYYGCLKGVLRLFSFSRFRWRVVASPRHPTFFTRATEYPHPLAMAAVGCLSSVRSDSAERFAHRIAFASLSM